jgi:hypothetical protein
VVDSGTGISRCVAGKAARDYGARSGQQTAVVSASHQATTELTLDSAEQLRLVRDLFRGRGLPYPDVTLGTPWRIVTTLYDETLGTGGKEDGPKWRKLAWLSRRGRKRPGGT